MKNLKNNIMMLELNLMNCYKRWLKNHRQDIVRHGAIRQETLTIL